MHAAGRFKLDRQGRTGRAHRNDRSGRPATPPDRRVPHGGNGLTGRRGTRTPLVRGTVRLVAARCASRPASRRPAYGGVGLPAGVRRIVRGRARRRRTRRERRAARPRSRTRLRPPAHPRRGGAPGACRGRGRRLREAATPVPTLVIPRRRVRSRAAPRGRPGRALGDGTSPARGQDGMG